MKKFLATIIILLILGAAGFFLGWAQLPVPPGSWAVMRSKTHGLDENLIRPGEFRWVWYKLIPTNVEILVFSPEKTECSLVSRGELPSGSFYAGFAGLDADFSWETGLDFSFNIKPSSLPALVGRENISSQEELRAYAASLGAGIEDFIIRRIRSYAEEGENIEDFLRAPGNSASLEAGVYGAFPEIEGFSCRIRSARFPDFNLYRSASQIYRDYLQKQREFLETDLARSAERRLSSQFRYDELERYGELLTKYPVLLRFLALESGLRDFSEE
jgi:hypothetical protein